MKNLCVLRVISAPLRFRVWVFAFLALASFAAPAQAQIEPATDLTRAEVRREAVEDVESLRGTEDISGRSSWMTGGLFRSAGWRSNVGGWVSTAYSFDDNNDRNPSAPDPLDHFFENQMRLFAGLSSASGRTHIYTRVLTSYTRNSGARLTRRSDWIQPALDMFYLTHSFGGSARKHSITAGRQFVMLERGIAFGQIADGLRYHTQSRAIETQLFLLRSRPGDDNIDYFAPDPGRSERLFFGGEWKWQFKTGHQLGMFLLLNQDGVDDAPDASGQRHGFDSNYLGLGADGLLGNFKYWFQFIREGGQTYASVTNTQVDVAANAVDLGVRYFFRTPKSPTLLFEYARASGDADATGDASTTTGGSTSGEDQRFIGFGALNLGYALAPQFTNIETYKYGFSFLPFGGHTFESLARLSFQSEAFIYNRARGSGAISDPKAVTGVGGSDRLGAGFDLTFSWLAAVDAKYQLKYGQFNPGVAYTSPNRTTEKYLRFKFSVDL